MEKRLLNIFKVYRFKGQIPCASYYVVVVYNLLHLKQLFLKKLLYITQHH